MASSDTSIPEAKVVLVGATMVGKTSIVTRVTSGEFDQEIKSTIGACYASKSFVINERTIKLQIWDTAGQERFRTLVPMYYRGAKVAIIVFSVDDLKSLDDVEFYADGIIDVAPPPPIIVVVANKIDLADRRCVTREQGETVAKKYNAEYFEISAQTGVNLDKMIQRVAEIAITQVNDEVESTVVINTTPQKKKKNCCK